MPNDFVPDFDKQQLLNIKIVGVGGAGGNVVNTMIETGIDGVEYIAVNTDKQALDESKAPTTLQIGEKITKGRGAGTIPEKAQRAAEESRDEIQTLLKNTTMLFITAGEGGGTGTGASPVVARIAKEIKIDPDDESARMLIVAVVTEPFSFEGKPKMVQAKAGIAELSKYVDSIIVIPNDKLRALNKEQKAVFKDGFKNADRMVANSVKRLADLIVGNGYVNVDFADIENALKNSGICHLATGNGKGKEKVKDAIEAVITNPLLTTSIDNARRVLVNIRLSDDVGFEDVSQFVDEITARCHEEAVVKWGATIVEDGSMQDEIEVTVVTAGYTDENETEESNVIPIPNASLNGQKSPVSSFARTTRPPVEPPPKPITATTNDFPNLNKQTDTAPPARPRSSRSDINELYNEIFGEEN
jgi:cell division protein FtsZ